MKVLVIGKGGETIQKITGELGVEIDIEDSGPGMAPEELAQLFAPFAEGGFPTPSGKCEFYSESLKAQGVDPLPFYNPPAELPSSNPQLARKYPLSFLSPPVRNFLNSSFANLPRFRDGDRFSLDVYKNLLRQAGWDATVFERNTEELAGRGAGAAGRRARAPCTSRSCVPSRAASRRRPAPTGCPSRSPRPAGCRAPSRGRRAGP